MRHSRFTEAQIIGMIKEWSSPGLMDTFHLKKESVLYAENEEPVPDGIQGSIGCADAITAAFPDAAVQTCIVHLVRHSLNFCAWKDRKVWTCHGIVPLL